MKILGIVSEYNPFHNGHRFHIMESKKAIMEDSAVVCVMSGDFVQRGDAAIFSKHTRAKAAILGGADLVFELPLPWSLASAEGFARGAIGMLGALSCVDFVSFGSECGDLKVLTSLARALLDPSINEKIKEEMKDGSSYATARQKALERESPLAEYLQTPNNILAVEYLKVILSDGLPLKAVTIKRVGAGHDEKGGSASDIRALMARGYTVSSYIPKKVHELFHEECLKGKGPVTLNSLESAIISRLRMLDADFFNKIPDASEGLGNRLFMSAREEATLDEIFTAVKTKRYALSRIRRMTMCAALGLTGDLVRAFPFPPFARVLAANEKGRQTLRKITAEAVIPVITKPAAVNSLPRECRSLFELGSSAHDLYVLGYQAQSERAGRADWRTSPAML